MRSILKIAKTNTFKITIFQAICNLFSTYLIGLGFFVIRTTPATFLNQFNIQSVDGKALSEVVSP